MNKQGALQMLARIWVWLKMTLGVESTAELLNLAVRKLVTPDVQAQLTTLILEMADLNLTGSEKKTKVIQKFDEIKASVLGNVLNLRAEVVSTAIDLIVGYLRLQGMIGYSAPTPPAPIQ
jgi:hypothetical protein